MNQLNCDVCGPTPALDRKVPLLTAASSENWQHVIDNYYTNKILIKKLKN
jgi:hypothetical protein